MTPSDILLAVLFAGFAVSFGWGIRGFVIGGEKGALLPGALLGIAVAFFAMGEEGKNLWMYFAAVGALFCAAGVAVAGTYFSQNSI